MQRGGKGRFTPRESEIFVFSLLPREDLALLYRAKREIVQWEMENSLVWSEYVCMCVYEERAERAKV